MNVNASLMEKIVIQINGWWNNDKYQCECEKRHACEKDYVGILLHVIVKMENI